MLCGCVRCACDGVAAVVLEVVQNSTEDCAYTIYLASPQGCSKNYQPSSSPAPSANPAPSDEPCSASHLDGCLAGLKACTSNGGDVCACQGSYVSCVKSIGCAPGFVQQQVDNCEAQGCTAAQCNA